MCYNTRLFSQWGLELTEIETDLCLLSDRIKGKCYHCLTSIWWLAFPTDLQVNFIGRNRILGEHNTSPHMCSISISIKLANQQFSTILSIGCPTALLCLHFITYLSDVFSSILLVLLNSTSFSHCLQKYKLHVCHYDTKNYNTSSNG